MNVSHLTIALLACTVGSMVACGDNKKEEKTSDWNCHEVTIPNGHTFECTSKITSAVTSDDGPVKDGPSYYCPAGVVDSDCPPVSVATSDGSQNSGAGAGAGGAGGGAGGSDTTSASSDSSNATGTNGGGTGGTGTGAAPAGSDGTSGTGTGTGGTGGRDSTGLDQPAVGSDGTSARGSLAGGAAGANVEIGGDFYCTREGGERTCRRAPSCDAGNHVVQMDCEPDQSSGLGSGAGGSMTGYPGAPSDASELGSGSTTQCFYPVGTAPGAGPPAATFEYILEAIAGVQQLHVRLTFSPHFVDNSYGAGSIGWARGHKFSELVGSDHAELTFLDKSGTEKLHFKQDYISASTTAPSGYACLGVTGGEGRMILGDASMIAKASSSLDRNLNDKGYKQFIVDSPASNDSFAPPANAPNWDYRVIYESWIKNEAFGASGFGDVRLAFVHASPSKANSNTLPVEAGPCPADWSNGAVR